MIILTRYKVYCLYDIRTNLIFYVGSSIRDMKYRMIEHRKPCNRHKRKSYGKFKGKPLVWEYVDS